MRRVEGVRVINGVVEVLRGSGLGSVNPTETPHLHWSRRGERGRGWTVGVVGGGGVGKGVVGGGG